MSSGVPVWSGWGLTLRLKVGLSPQPVAHCQRGAAVITEEPDFLSSCLSCCDSTCWTLLSRPSSVPS